MKEAKRKEKEKVLERFLRFVRIPTQSDETNPEMPSTPEQTTFAQSLAAELRAIGVPDVFLETNGILYAKLPGTIDAPSIGFCAHYDTVDVGLSPRVTPQILTYRGEDLVLNHETGTIFRAKDHPELADYIGEEVVFSDATSVLGADDKAGVAAIVTMLETLIAENRLHGDVYAAFFPDEEIGLRGGKNVDLTRFCPTYAYTVDGGAIGEVEYETFNAASAIITVTGVSVHPGSAKGVLVNPILIAADIINAFDRADTPENSEGYEGYFWVADISGNPTRAQVTVTIRDFDLRKFEARKAAVRQIVAEVAHRHPRAQVTCDITDTYANIASFMTDKKSVNIVLEALQLLQIKARCVPVRGGTDGSAMSQRGLVTPNIFTGGLNPHAPFECLPVRGLEASLATLLTMVEVVAFGANRPKD